MGIFKYLQINDNFWQARRSSKTKTQTRNLDMVFATHITKNGLVVRIYQEGLLCKRSTQMEKVDKDSKQCFKEEETRFSNKLEQRGSASFTVREMQKHNEINHFVSIRLAKIDHTKCSQPYGKRMDHSTS